MNSFLKQRTGEYKRKCEDWDRKSEAELKKLDTEISDIKAKLCMWLEDQWDHKTLIWENDPWAKVLPNIDPTIVIVPFNPTAENIAQHLVEVIGPQQLAGTGIKLVHCDVEETRKCSASFHV